MKPLTISSFKINNIRAVSSDQKSVDDFSYTSVKFEYDGDKCMIKIFRGGEWWWMGRGGSSERCLKWGGGG